MIERTDQLVVVIGTPVDEFLGPSMTVFEKAVDQISPHLRDGALVVLRSTVYPGTTGVRRPAPRRSRLRRRCGVLPGADRRGPCARGAPLAAADRRRRRRRAPPNARPRCSARLASKTIRTTHQGSRAGQALHEHVALHEVRGRQPVPHDRRPGRRGLHQRPARDPRGLPARRRPAGPRFRRRSVPVQGHDAAGGVHADHFPLGQAAMQVNEGLPAYIVSALERRYGGLKGKTVGILGHGVQVRIGRPARVAQLQAAQAAVVGRRPRPGHGSVRHRRPARHRWSASSRRATSWSSGRRTRHTAASSSAARTSSTSGALWVASL